MLAASRGAFLSSACAGQAGSDLSWPSLSCRAGSGSDPDFDDEARKIFAGLGVSSTGMYVIERVATAPRRIGEGRGLAQCISSMLLTFCRYLAGGMGGGRYNSCDPIWKHPATGGTIFVGNVSSFQCVGSGALTQRGLEACARWYAVHTYTKHLISNNATGSGSERHFRPAAA
jgi:hypothetical protein